MKEVVIVGQKYTKVLMELIEKKAKFKCVTFSDQEEALRYILQKDIYAVICEYQMSKLNNIFWMEFVNSNTTIIIVSALKSDIIKAELRKSGDDIKNIKFLCKSNMLSIIDMI